MAPSTAPEAVSALVHTYAELLDDGDLDGVADLFAGATWRSGGGTVRCGTEEVRRAYDPVILYEGVPRTHHLISNLTVEIEGELARSRCYFSVVQAAPGRQPEIILAGRYHDEFALGPASWRFTDRLILADLIGDLRRHMRAPR